MSYGVSQAGVKKDEEKHTDPRNDGEECFTNRGGLSERNKSNTRKSKDTRDGDDNCGGRRRGTRGDIHASLIHATAETVFFLAETTNNTFFLQAHFLLAASCAR